MGLRREVTAVTTENPIRALLRGRTSGRARGIYACCSANEYVLRAAFRRARTAGTVTLVESTANQVNQEGGYTGMTPRRFRTFVDELARQEGAERGSVICGGDHLGPLTWRRLPEKEAMARAEALVAAYAEAGFAKLHLDTSMRLADDDPQARLPDEVIARRGARLCRAAEEAFGRYRQQYPQAPPPVYVIGSEVPVPGGAQENEERVEVTAAADCEATLEQYRQAFCREGLSEAWERVVALVVQPGVEFADESVVLYNRAAAASLTAWLRSRPGLVFEGHSTDYQPREKLRQLAEDGVAILKVGPALTFALREGLFALEGIEQELHGLEEFPLSGLRAALERAMVEDSGQWESYYHGSTAQKRYSRAFSYSDRSRYYLTSEPVRQATRRLLHNLSGRRIPPALLSQYLPKQYTRVQAGTLAGEAEALLIDRVGDCIDDYLYAVLRE